MAKSTLVAETILKAQAKEEATEKLDRAAALKANMTPNGRTLVINRVPNTALYRPAFKEGGDLPKELEGMFTDPYRAQDAITVYLNTRWDEAANATG